MDTFTFVNLQGFRHPQTESWEWMVPPFSPPSVHTWGHGAGGGISQCGDWALRGNGC